MIVIRTHLTSFLLLALWLCPRPAAMAQVAELANKSIHVRTIEGLTQRRLFTLAIAHAERALADDSVSTRESTDIVVAMIDTLSQQAWQGNDEALWERARDAARAWEDRIEEPGKTLIRVQAALIDQLQIEKWARQVETDSAPSGTREKAVAAVSRVNARFDQLKSEVTTLLNRRPGPREQEFGYTPDQWLTLRYNLEYQQARALLNRASMYGSGQELNRDDTLTQVEQRLVSVLQSIRPEQTLWWNVQADRIAMAITRRDFRKAAELYRSLPMKTAAIDDRQQVNAEWIRALSEAGQMEEAIAVAGKSTLASTSPRLDLARVELFVAMAGQDSDPAWQQRALDLTAGIEQQHGGYWGRLANLSVVGTASSQGAPGTNLDLLIRVADEAQRKKQWPEAIKALDAAFEKSAAAGQQEIAWKLGFRAASIAQTLQQHDNAADRFESLASSYPNLAQSHTGQLMACWNLTRTMQGDSEKQLRYESMLESLIEKWPNSSSADQARIWLAAIRRAQENWAAAIGLLLDINPASQLFSRAVIDLRLATQRFMNQPELSPESGRNVQSALVVRLAPLLDVASEAMPDNWPTTRAWILITLSESSMIYGTDVPRDLDTGLSQLTEAPGLPASLVDHVKTMQLIARLKSGSIASLSKVKVSPEFQQEQLNLFLAALTQFRNGTYTVSVEVAPALMWVYEYYESEISELPDSSKRAWDLATLEALLASGQSSQAVDLAQQMADIRYPRDLAVQLRTAELLTQLSANDAAQQEAALRQWRKIARASRQNSSTWYRAKYQVASLLSEQGNKAEALKLLKFIQAVPPGWENAPDPAAFDELFRSLGGK